MFRRGLTTQLRWFFVVLFVVCVFGWIADYFFQIVIIYLLGYIFWTYFQMMQLVDWVTSVRHNGPITRSFNGAWADIADEVTRLHNLYQKDKQRLQAVVQRIQKMTYALEDGVVLIDKKANIEWWNNIAKDYFEFQEVDNGQRLENIIRHPKFVKYFEGGDYSDPLEIEGLRREGQFLEFRVHPFGQGERLLVVREITRVKKLEQMRKDFVGNVSHELRTPLTVIRGYLETLIDMPDLSATMEKALQQMVQQGHRMTNLVNDLITLSRLETDSVDNAAEYVDVVPLISTILSDARAINNAEKHTLTRSGEEDIQILGNASQLRSAFSNLVFNAVKYSPSGCNVEVAVKILGNECIVSVIDDGVGIDSKHLPRLTERFYRVDDGRSTNMGGTGLGLAIVKHVLLRHDSVLKVRSRPGKGSTFSCHFPIKRVKRKELAPEKTIATK